jgi:LysR family glycine cleavage system transcriptional activator
MAAEPLLGAAKLWTRFFGIAGLATSPTPVASFNDAGLMLQAAEHGIGIALGRQLLAADALRDGTLVRLSPIELPDDEAYAYWFAYPTELAGWPPVVAFRAWMQAELAQGAAAPGPVPHAA